MYGVTEYVALTKPSSQIHQTWRWPWPISATTSTSSLIGRAAEQMKTLLYKGPIKYLPAHSVSSSHNKEKPFLLFLITALGLLPFNQYVEMDLSLINLGHWIKKSSQSHIRERKLEKGRDWTFPLKGHHFAYQMSYQPFFLPTWAGGKPIFAERCF